MGNSRGLLFLGGTAVCLKDLMVVLQGLGHVVTEAQIRWAIKSGKVSRPSLDGSLRFNFGEQHVREFCSYFNRESCEVWLALKCKCEA
jgi:hypothetical protein